MFGGYVGDSFQPPISIRLAVSMTCASDTESESGISAGWSTEARLLSFSSSRIR
jgi:hypothetical protein